MKFPSALAIGFAAALACGPALAQNTKPGATQTAPPPQPPAAATTPAPQTAPPQPAAATTGNSEAGTATINPTGLPPSQRNPLLTNGGQVQISKLLGTNIYNKNDKNIGSVQEVLADHTGQLQVVVNSNGKHVLVPWDKLKFGDAKLNSDNKVLMPDATQQSLATMPAYNPQGKGNG